MPSCVGGGGGFALEVFTTPQVFTRRRKHLHNTGCICHCFEVSSFAEVRTVWRALFEASCAGTKTLYLAALFEAVRFEPSYLCLSRVRRASRGERAYLISPQAGRSAIGENCPLVTLRCGTSLVLGEISAPGRNRGESPLRDTPCPLRKRLIYRNP